MEPDKKRILCVDDDSSTCELISYLLKDFEVISVHSMEHGIRHATEGGFDLFLLDYHLTDGSGFRLCLFIRQFDKETPILFVTSASITDNQVLTIGAQGLVKKGDDLSDNLVPTVERLLSGGELSQLR